MSAWSYFNIQINESILKTEEELRALEKQGHDSKKLMEQYTAHVADKNSKKSKYGFLFFLSIGLATPPMLYDCFTGSLAWSEMFAYMVALAWMGTISGMVIMSMNYPFIIHTVSYTFSGVMLAILTCQEHGRLSKLK